MILEVTSSGCFEDEFVKVLQSEYHLDSQYRHQRILLPQFVLLENSSLYPWDVIGSALCSSGGFSSPSQSWNVSDLFILMPLYFLSPYECLSASCKIVDSNSKLSSTFINRQKRNWNCLLLWSQNFTYWFELLTS